MTAFNALAEGHIERRNPPYKHPMENAMSPEQWERLQDFLTDASKKLEVIAEVRAENEHLKADLDQELQKNSALTSSMSSLQTDHAALEIKLAALERSVAAQQNDSNALKEEADKWHKQVQALEAERAEAIANSLAFIASVDRKDQEITILKAQLKEARAHVENAESAGHKAAAKNKDKRGADD